MARPITDMLRDQRGGALVSELDGELARCVHAAKTLQQPSELILKLKITPNGEEMVIVTDQVMSKLPVPKRPSTSFFIDDDNGLVRRDPRQQDMQLRSVAEDAPHPLKKA